MFDTFKVVMQLIGNSITILGLVLFIIIFTKKVHKDLKEKRELKKIEKDNAKKESALKEKLYKDYLALQKIQKESKDEKENKK